MKKLIGVSLIAMLAVGPLAANATPDYASAIPAEPVTVTANTNVASTSYVQGAYNAAVAVANKENQRALAAEGDLTTLTTTEKGSLVGAINEINTTAGNAADKDLSNLSATGTGVITTAITNNAAGATYSNSTSGLTATTIQDAIDEVAGTAGDAADKSLSNINSAGETVIKNLAADGAYSNSTSGLTATTIQDAIDEVAGTAGDAADKDLSNLSATGTGVITTAITNNAAGATYSNSTSGLTATTIQDAIDEVAGTAGDAADKDLSNLSATGTGVITTAITNNAAGATYSNSTSGLTATTLQDAIDEVAAAVDDQGAKVLKVYTTWNTSTNQEVTLTDPTPVQPQP